MFIEKFLNNGKDYIRLSKTVRRRNKKGFMVSSKDIILNIGPLDRYDDGKPNYLERLRESFRAGEPLIPALKQYCEKEEPEEYYTIQIKRGGEFCQGEGRMVAPILLEKILEELGLNAVFASCKHDTKIKYDVYGFFKLLVFGRLIDPASKRATVQQNDLYYEPILKNFNPYNVYDTLSFIDKCKDQIIRRINTNLVRKAGRSPEIIYYDVTNFYFEIDDPDEDVLDADGNVIEGMRKMGMCKQERRLPVVQMGLFMDDNGLPISIETFPGNTPDQKTLRAALSKNIDGLDYSRFILIADRGICNYPNLLHVLDGGNGYIVSKSLMKSKKEEKDWAYDDEGYIFVGKNFKYKSKIVTKTVKDQYGNNREIQEKVVVYWSKKYQERKEYECSELFAFLKELKENPGNFKVTAIQSKQLRKFYKNKYININTGELINSKEIRPLIDDKKIEKYRKNLGYYQIVSSELDMDAVEIINKYQGLTQIEDQFREMKNTLDTQPILVWTPEHIRAHLLICLIALIVLRIIQRNTIEVGICKKDADTYWSNGLNSDKIRNALQEWRVYRTPDDLYMFLNMDNENVKTVLKAFNLDIPKDLFTSTGLKKLKKNMKVF